jgi:hypothetical protein
MSTVREIKEAVRRLPVAKRLKVARWVSKFENDEWDKQMSRDAANGKLNFLIAEAKDAAKKGKLRPFPHL